MAIENVDRNSGFTQLEDCDVPSFFVCLLEGKPWFLGIFPVTAQLLKMALQMQQFITLALLEAQVGNNNSSPC